MRTWGLGHGWLDLLAVMWGIGIWEVGSGWIWELWIYWLLCGGAGFGWDLDMGIWTSRVGHEDLGTWGLQKLDMGTWEVGSIWLLFGGLDMGGWIWLDMGSLGNIGLLYGELDLLVAIWGIGI